MKVNVSSHLERKRARRETIEALGPNEYGFGGGATAPEIYRIRLTADEAEERAAEAIAIPSGDIATALAEALTGEHRKHRKHREHRKRKSDQQT